MFLTKSWLAWHLMSPCKIQKQSKQIIPLHILTSQSHTPNQFPLSNEGNTEINIVQTKTHEIIFDSYLHFTHHIESRQTLPQGLHICCSFLLEYSSPTYMHASHSHRILKVLWWNVTMSVSPSLSTLSCCNFFLTLPIYSISNLLFLLKPLSQYFTYLFF